MRLGLLGGTFDPVHFGHLLLAEYCREGCGLDEVWFLPAAVPPHKQGGNISLARQRIEMLELATAGHTAFRVSPLEIERGGVSYTFQTLERLRDEDRGRELYFLMGADSLADLPNWKEPRRILELAIPVVVQRRGSPQPDLQVLAELTTPERFAAMQQAVVEFPSIELSSTEIRRRIAAGHSIRYQTPRAVEKYIETHGLYRSAAQ